jgi:hypothetical protein
MRSSRDNEKHKPTVRKAGGIKAGGMKTSKTKDQQAPPEPDKKATASPKVQPKSTSIPAGPALTQEVFRARVAQKAFQLYEKRMALNEVDDWVEAERLTKLELLSEGHGAGSV